jgi:hypothetical protein
MLRNLSRDLPEPTGSRCHLTVDMVERTNGQTVGGGQRGTGSTVAQRAQARCVEDAHVRSP